LTVGELNGGAVVDVGLAPPGLPPLPPQLDEMRVMEMPTTAATEKLTGRWRIFMSDLSR
jgi:hypothetical protein